MIVHSKTIISFIARIKEYALHIMREEMKLPLRGERVEWDGYIYRIQFVAFENEKLLGFCHARLLQIGINRNLMYTTGDEKIKNILRHELAHLMTAWKYGYEVRDHGSEFRKVCKGYGWGRDVQGAEDDISSLKEGKERGDIPNEKIIQKVKKLMSLATSGNLHEAESATLKANQLLLRHNLDEINAKSLQEESTTYVENILKTRKITGKIRAIMTILETFYVYPVCNYGHEIVYVQVIGNRTNVALAEYVAGFLDRELERLWHLNKKKSNLSRGKKWFMYGVSRGYKEKIERQAQTIFKENEKAMVSLKEDLMKCVSQIYPRLSSLSRSMGRFDDKSLKAGYEEGNNLSIHQGVDSTENPLFID